MISRSGALILYAFILVAWLIMFSPTIFYLAVAPAVFDYMSYDTPARAIAGKLLYAGIPLLCWAVARIRAECRTRSFQARLAEIPKCVLDGPVPRELVVEGGSASLAYNFHKIAGIERLYEPAGRSGSSWNLIDLANRGKNIERVPVETLPPRHLLLRCERASRFVDPKLGRAAGGGPFELSLVDGEQEHLLGLCYEPRIRIPIFPPLLTLNGWFSRSNSMSTDRIRAKVEQFLVATLSGAGSTLPESPRTFR